MKYTASLGLNFQKGAQSNFVLEDTDGETIRKIVKFCYTGEIDLNEDNVEKCFAVASSIELDLLMMVLNILQSKLKKSAPL